MGLEEGLEGGDGVGKEEILDWMVGAFGRWRLKGGGGCCCC